MRRLIILAEVALGLLFASCTKEEQRTLSVIPAPLKVELQQEVFSLNSETGLYIDASEGDKKILEDYLVASSMNLKPVIAEEGHNVVLKHFEIKVSSLQRYDFCIFIFRIYSVI